MPQAQRLLVRARQNVRSVWQKLLAAPDDCKRHSYKVAIALAVLTILIALPAIPHWRLASAPGWARLTLLTAGLQLAYVAWLATNPNWTAMWVAMIVLAATATMLAVAGSMLLMAPFDADLPLGLDALPRGAASWRFAGAIVSAAASYYCGHMAQLWRRQPATR
jgi:hypothetical protein